jgi:hypothetical protein
MAVAGLGSMCNVAKQCAQTVMRADSLLLCLANVEGWPLHLFFMPMIFDA